MLFSIINPAFIRPHLEYAAYVWNDLSKADTLRIEKNQQRATKLVIGLKTKIYEDRLKELNLTTLGVVLDRRKRGDLIQVFKLMRGLEDMDIKINKQNIHIDLWLL